jgi:hypothetical protein
MINSSAYANFAVQFGHKLSAHSKGMAVERTQRPAGGSAAEAERGGEKVSQKARPAMPHRHFPAPWSLEEQADCFIVRDHNGQALTYVYFEDEPLRRSGGKPLSRNEARRIAAIMANLPEVMPHTSEHRLKKRLSRPSRSFAFSNRMHVEDFIVLFLLGMFGTVAAVFIALLVL